jgi:hypothetical protein
MLYDHGDMASLTSVFATSLALTAVLGLATQASAVTAEWDFTTAAPHIHAFGESEAFAAISGGNTLKASAFNTSNNSGSGSFVAAALNHDTQGLGVTAKVGTGSEAIGAGAQQLDNSGRDELILLELPADDSDPISLTFSAVQANDDARVWIGGSGAGLSLTGAFFATLGTLGLTLVHDGDLPGTGNNVTLLLSGSETGRYVVIAGRAEGNDDFRIKAFAAETAAAQVPGLPGLVLIASGVLAVLLWPPRKSGS